MKTLQQIKGYKSQTLDGRDVTRLAQFLPESYLDGIGLIIKEGYVHEPLPLTKDNVLKQLEQDVAFGFEKALNQRGLSSAMMHEVVRMWNWVLEEGLEDNDDYGMYGLPLFKATALKYGFPNPIGEDNGNEEKYAT